MVYNRKQRLNDNIKAIETAFILDREQRTPTARERLLLERYCGFGGLKCILNPARELADAVHWAKSDLELFAPIHLLDGGTETVHQLFVLAFILAVFTDKSMQLHGWSKQLKV